MVIQKSKSGTIILVMVVVLFSLIVGCGGKGPESVFGTAQFEEQQTNCAHAKEGVEELEKPDLP